MHAQNIKHFGIAGAGLLGRILALNLVRLGYRVSLFDADILNGEQAAGLTAAGMLAPFAEMETADSGLLAMGLKSIQIWPGLVKLIGISEAFQQKGSLITAHPTDMAELTHFIAQLKSKVDLAGKIERLDQNAIQALEPELVAHNHGYFLPLEAQVNAQAFMAASQAYLLAHSQVTWRAQSFVTQVDQGMIQTERSTFAFDWVFDTRGLGTKADFSQLRGVRGEVFWLDAPDVNLNRPVRLMHPRYRIYIVPRPNHRYVVGATEIESEDLSPMSVRSSLELLSAVYSVHKGFGEARIVKTLTNCRPALPDNLPKIKHGAKVTRLNGLYRHGYLLAPAVVQQALEELDL